MSTLSVPLTADLERYINDKVRRGEAANRADVVRRAIRKMSEDEAIEAVLQSEREIKEGKVIYGDIREIMAKMSK